MLTDKQAKAAKPQGRDYKLADSGGLYLFVTTAGAKIWRMKYRFAGHERRLIFGPYPDVSLVEAREQRDAAKKALRDGRDPGAEKKQQAAAAVVAAGNTFESIARHWHALQKARWTDGHAGVVLNSLEEDVFPAIGKTPITDLTPPMILNLLRPIEARDAVETARRIRQRISCVFEHGIASGLCDTDPAAAVTRALAKAKRGRHPALTKLEDARTMLVAVEARPAHPVVKLAHRLLAITAVRLGALQGAPWDEFADLGAEPLWQIPAARMKLLKENKDDEARDLWVPLPTQAVEVIDALRSVTGRGTLVFPGPRKGRKPFAQTSVSRLTEKAGYKGKHVPHGWRTTFSTIMNERFRADDRIIDLMLGHVRKDKTEAAYNRADHLERRRELGQIWADLLMEGLPPAASLLEGRRR